MPDVHEVFRVATEKINQDPGAIERQIRRQRRAVRNRRLSAFATVALIVLVTVAAYAFLGSIKRGEPAHGPTPPPIRPPAASSMVDLRTGQITPLPASIAMSGSYYAISPDHTKVAYSYCCTPPVPLFVANVDGTHIRQVTAPGLDAYGAQWSPDGSLLVYQQRDAYTFLLGNLYVLDVSTGKQTQLTHFDQSKSWDWWFTFPSFRPGTAPGSDTILFQLPRGDRKNPVWDLWMVPVSGGRQVLVRRNAGWGGFSIFSPTSRDLAYLSPVSAKDFSGETLWIDSYDTRTGPRALVTGGHLSWPRWSPDGTRISYSNNDRIYVVDVATGSTVQVAKGSTAEWFDDHTLIVGPGRSVG